jgi:hypothetical protein
MPIPGSVVGLNQSIASWGMGGWLNVFGLFAADLVRFWKVGDGLKI